MIQEDSFKKSISSINHSYLRRTSLEILQVNLGNMCNQRCIHCHVGASPKGTNIMSKKIMDDIANFASRKKCLTLDITGGCPELNPNFKYFVEKTKPYVKRIQVRSNLTVIFEKGMKDLPQFYKKNNIKIIASMPCYTKENVDKQRGGGVFDKSIKALKILNSIGYGKEKNLELDLVYNPGGAFLPDNQENLERNYKKILYDEHGVLFNYLITITNAPIKRFRHYLEANGDFDKYMNLLIDNFNPDVVGNIMCRNLLSVAWDGIIYDCDFNQALGLALRDESGKIAEIRTVDPGDLENKEITFENHCFCCTVGAGSSCRGALTK